ncbi:MAG: gliding motility-associated C-terminal domain-containing protein, partial [Bacteroidales bacterium]|nr:gliding motility-associated C-terminal domain-containing protein [Bacteroidales bacterium]
VQHTYGDWGIYTVTLTVTTDNGCTHTIQDTVVLEPDLAFPNIITPNGDNSNDVFAITNLSTDFDPNDPDGVRSNELFIFDRWGKRVYHAKNYDTYAKDGEIHIGTQYFDAQDLSDGVYFYTFHYNGAIRPIDYHGTLSVIR